LPSPRFVAGPDSGRSLFAVVTPPVAAHLGRRERGFVKLKWVKPHVVFGLRKRSRASLTARFIGGCGDHESSRD
jgi:predicted NAD-dependent protein-ADP-ribosyltransferase YbiA (DUF1768 family)